MIQTDLNNHHNMIFKSILYTLVGEVRAEESSGELLIIWAVLLSACCCCCCGGGGGWEEEGGCCSPDAAAPAELGGGCKLTMVGAAAVDDMSRIFLAFGGLR